MAQQAPQIEFDRSLLGKDIPAGDFTVVRQQIQEFCAAVGEANPKYVHGDEAPPTFCNVLVRQGFTRPDIKLKFGTTGIHGGQAVDPIKPIKAGDHLNSRTHLKEVYAKTGRTGTMVFVVWETVFANDRGEDVARFRESYINR